MENLDQFTQRVRRHVRHIEEVGAHCDSEETTKQALILPLLEILGYNPYDPSKVKAEFQSDVPGVKRSERVDYALFSDGKPVMFIEAKAYVERLTNHANQLARYFNATPGVCVTAITNGREWRFFTDLQHDNIMDEEPFFVIDFLDLQDSHIKELALFRHEVIDTTGLRSFAENLTYLTKFKQVVETCLKGKEPDFVRFVANKAMPNLRITQRVLDSIAPLVKRAVAETMIDMVAGSLNAANRPVEEVSPPATDTEQASEGTIKPAEVIDPNNPKVITTEDELRLLSAAKKLLRGIAEEGEITAKDTESYYALLYQGKNNRWLLRYNVNRRQPIVQFIMGLDEDHRKEVARAGLEIGAGDAILLSSPDDIMRIPGLLYDALAYCREDSNFKRVAER